MLFPSFRRMLPVLIALAAACQPAVTPTPTEDGAARLQTQIVGTATALRLTALAVTPEAPTATPPPTGHTSEQGVSIRILGGRLIGAVDYEVSGPVVIAITPPETPAAVEFFLTPTGAGMTPVREFVDEDGRDGWTWAWTPPGPGLLAHLWAEAVYADGTRRVSPVLLVLVPDPTPQAP